VDVSCRQSVETDEAHFRALTGLAPTRERDTATSITHRKYKYLTTVLHSLIILKIYHSFLRKFHFNIVTCRPIARQQIGKQVTPKTDSWLRVRC
jgi:hypothetical protein